MGASAIGDNAGVDKLLGDVGGAGHIAAHALLGCAAAAAGDKDCASGAIGGATSAALTPYIDQFTGMHDPLARSATITALAAFAGGTVAGALGRDANVALSAAQNEAQNNYLTHKQLSDFDKAVAKCKATPGCDIRTIVNDYRNLSAEQDKQLAYGCADKGTCDKVWVAADSGIGYLKDKGSLNWFDTRLFDLGLTTPSFGTGDASLDAFYRDILKDDMNMRLGVEFQKVDASRAQNLAEMQDNITVGLFGMALAKNLRNSAAGGIGSAIGESASIAGGIDEGVGAARGASRDVYRGIKEASEYLQDAGVPRERRVEILRSFEPDTIRIRSAGDGEYGIRYFDNMNAKPDGRYLFETFPASRDSLAVLPEWNQMTGMRQFQITPGTLIIEGRAASQGSYPGGQVQKFILDPKTGLIPISGK